MANNTEFGSGSSLPNYPSNPSVPVGGELTTDERNEHYNVALPEAPKDVIIITEKGESGTDGQAGAQGLPGADGKSAYEIAVDNGYVGTEEQWLASLKGADGKDGIDGTNGTNGTDGTDGDSAYQVAVNNGYVGTEEEWLLSLRGEDGTPGTQGPAMTFDDLTDEQIAALTGPKGDDGEIGPQGDKGDPGDDLILLASGNYALQDYTISFAVDNGVPKLTIDTLNDSMKVYFAKNETFITNLKTFVSTANPFSFTFGTETAPNVCVVFARRIGEYEAEITTGTYSLSSARRTDGFLAELISMMPLNSLPLAMVIIPDETTYNSTGLYKMFNFGYYLKQIVGLNITGENIGNQQTPGVGIYLGMSQDNSKLQMRRLKAGAGVSFAITADQELEIASSTSSDASQVTYAPYVHSTWNGATEIKVDDALDFLGEIVDTYTTSYNRQMVFVDGHTYKGSGMYYDKTSGNFALGLNVPSTPLDKLHIDLGTGTAAYTRYTAGTTTGQTATSGVKYGIDSSGNAIIWNYGAKTVSIGTNNLNRLNVEADGTIAVATANYYQLVTDDNDIPNRKYVHNTFLPLGGGTMTGHLLFTDNAYDIGASGATRPRTGYFGTSVYSPLVYSNDIDLASTRLNSILANKQNLNGIYIDPRNASSRIYYTMNQNIGTSDFTISYKITVDGGGTITFSSLHTSNVQPYAIRTYISSDLTQLVFVLYGSTTSDYKRITINPSTSYSGQTIDVTIVRKTSNASVKIYINGILQNATEYNSGNAPTWDGSVTSTYCIIGNTNAAYPSNQIISDISVLNRALTEAEVKLYRGRQLPYSDRKASLTQLTSGTLLKGKRYKIVNFVTGDDFTNIGGTNVTDNEFVTTGTTPTTWTNASSLMQIGCFFEPELENVNSDVSTIAYDRTGNYTGTIVGYVYSVKRSSTPYQPLDADLTAIAALAGTSGFLKKTADNTWILDTNTYLTTNQNITLSGDVSGSGSTSITTTIGANKVTTSMLSQVATASFLGRVTTGTGNVEVLTVENVKTMLGLGTAAYTASTAYEPAIGKSTGYLKWTGSVWSFVNETYSLFNHSHYGLLGESDFYNTYSDETSFPVTPFLLIGENYDHISAGGVEQLVLYKASGASGMQFRSGDNTWSIGTGCTTVGAGKMYIRRKTATENNLVFGVNDTLGVLVNDPTAYLHIHAGTTNIPGLKLSNGDILTNAQVGAFEFQETSLFFTLIDGSDPVRKQFSWSDHTHNYEPAITKGTGYAKWNGSAWSFVNETYSLSSHNHDSVYAPIVHTHSYLPLTGGIITGSIQADNEVTGSGSINYYTNVCSYLNNTSPVVGTIKITLPKTWSNTMLKLTIKGYNYTSTTGGWEVIVSGYNYLSTTQWYNPSVELRGNAPFTSVRLAHDGTKCCILLGDISTSWNYPSISITDVIASKNNISDWGAGYEMSIITDETGIANVSTPTLKKYWTSYNDGSTSGLDADLLDGQEGSYYAVATHNHDSVYSVLGHTHNYQPFDSDLTAIATLTGSTGFLKKTGEGTWTIDTSTYSLSTHNHDGVYSATNHTHSGVYEVPITFSSGLTRTDNTITNDLITGKSGGQIIYGGNQNDETLKILATTGSGGKIGYGGNTSSSYTHYFTGSIGTSSSLAVGSSATISSTLTTTYATTNSVGTSGGITVGPATSATSSVQVKWSPPVRLACYAYNGSSSISNSFYQFSNSLNTTNGDPIFSKLHTIAYTINGNAELKYLTTLTYDSTNHEPLFGIGTQIPYSKLHLNEPTDSTVVYQQFTNAATGAASAADGTLVGLDASGNFIINQQESLSLKLQIGGSNAISIEATNKIGYGGAASASYAHYFTGSVASTAGNSATAYNASQNFISTRNLTTTFTDGFAAINSTLATVGTPVKISPGMYFSGTAWNTTPTAAAKINRIGFYLHPVSGEVTSGNLIFKSLIINGVSTENDLFVINTSGWTNRLNTVYHYLAASATADAVNDMRYRNDSGRFIVEKCTELNATKGSGTWEITSDVVPINAQSGTTYTLALTDLGKLLKFTYASGNVTVTVPPNSSVAFPIGSKIDLVQYFSATYKLTLAQGSGVTINSKDSNKSAADQYVGLTLTKMGTDEWLLVGDLIA